ncbi:NADH-quinone oxidoreductase subunit L [Kineosporiaceae bacterium SCSIO 59966]|nr:NADH-quinone oxidoreductase subunit L [Kineosporiaceae bacterium SCSIO 59966]
MSALLAALVAVPALTGGALLLAGRRADRVAAPTAVAAAALTLLAAVAAADTRPQAEARFVGLVDGGELALAVDALSAVMVVTVATVTAVLTVFAAADLPRDAARARFFGFLLLFAAAMHVTVTASTLTTLLLAWEVMGMASYALIAFHWELPGKVEAGTTAFLTTRAADLGLYVAAGAALAGTGSLRLADLPGADGPWLHVAAAGVLLAALGKSAQLPFSAWLSAAMEGPSPVSALLHSATMVAAGGYLLIRLHPLLQATGWAAPAAAWAGALTALVLGAVALAQRDVKQLLAASTAAQIGFVVLAAGVSGLAAGTSHLVAHAAVKAALFVAAGAWLTSLGTKKLAELRGAARRQRGVGAAAVVAALALSGVPPLALWATKEQVLASVHGEALHVVALAAAALSAGYAGKLLGVVLARPDDAPDGEAPAVARVPVATTAVAVTLALPAAGLGVLALPSVGRWVRTLLGVPAEPVAAPADLVVSAVLATGVLAAVLLWPALTTAVERTPLHRWAGLGALLTGRPVTALAHGLAAVDEGGVDRLVMSAATGTTGLAGRVTRFDRSGVDGAVTATARALYRVGGLARRPQTGLLHQYYAMAAGGLGLLLVLLLIGG